MPYSFSAEFLKVIPPDTTFGNAWESMCFSLLSAEHGVLDLQRFNAPDGGIDIFQKSIATAIQCKSDERGSFGSLSAGETVKSLQSAVNGRALLNWQRFVLASNANYTMPAVKSILEEAAALGLKSSEVDFLGPEYWSELCERHFDHVRDRFDFRITVTEAQDLEAFRKARYYDQYVNKFAEAISRGNFVLRIKNNRTPLVLELPFAPDLSVENCVDAVRELLGVSLKWTNFTDLETSAGPSISLSVNRRAQGFKQTIAEVLSANPGEELEFWITVVWKDNPVDDGTDDSALYLRRYATFDSVARSSLSAPNRRTATIGRAEKLIQMSMWDAASRLKNPDSRN